jgi:hypothetical protein
MFIYNLLMLAFKRSQCEITFMNVFVDHVLIPRRLAQSGELQTCSEEVSMIESSIEI